MVMMSLLKMVAFFVLMVLSAVWFFRSDDMKEWIGYAALFLWCATSVAFLWIFHCMLLTRNATGRELKRLELRIAELVERLANKS